MKAVSNRARIILVAVFVVILSVTHYTADALHWEYLHTDYQHYLYHAFFFLPLILAGFWFGLRGAVITSLIITAANLPDVLHHIHAFSPLKFYYLLQVGIYNIVAVSLGILRDRERKEQERSRMDENLAAMGKALSCVAHDMKTPLIAIGGFSQMLLKNMDDKDPGRAKLEIVVKEARRLELMVKEMLDFSRPLELHKSEEDMCRLIEESLAVVHDLAEQKQVRIQCAPATLPHISMDCMRMKQVIINLVINAIEASPQGEAVVVSSFREANNIIVDVRDRGDGIPADKKDTIFSPFFTTKKEGTGLGLPIARKIIDAHLGRLEMFTAPEKGIVFRVSLPLL